MNQWISAFAEMTIKVLPKGLYPYYPAAVVVADGAPRIFTNFIPDNSRT